MQAKNQRATGRFQTIETSDRTQQQNLPEERIQLKSQKETGQLTKQARYRTQRNRHTLKKTRRQIFY